jgi:hypothetical protein
MKKTLFIVIAVLLACGTALAQEQERKTGPRIAEWLKGLQQKIALIAPKKIVPVSTGVAGVRGAKEDTQVKLYWKGKKGEEAVSEEELAEFKQAVECAEKGDSATAVKELEEFMKKFPDSCLIPDAKKTLDIVKAEPAEPKPEEKMEIKAEQKPEEKVQISEEEIEKQKKE